MTMTTQNRSIVVQAGRQRLSRRLVAALVMGGSCSSGGNGVLLVQLECEHEDRRVE